MLYHNVVKVVFILSMTSLISCSHKAIVLSSIQIIEVVHGGCNFVSKAKEHFVALSKPFAKP